MGRKGSGVEIRGNSIRVQFVHEGETVRETLMLNGAPMPPTLANVKFANRLVATVRDKIKTGTLDYAEFFPESPRAVIAPPKSFGKLADLWLESKGQLVDATLGQYTNGVGVWKKLLGENTSIPRLTYQVLAAKIGGHTWASPKSCNNYLIVLRGIFAFEYTGRRTADNPMIGIKNLPPVRKLPDPLTPDERDVILADIAKRYDARVLAYFTFAFFTGMRPEELIALRWGDFDFMSKTVKVQRVRTFRGSERDGSKTHAERDVDLVARALAAIEAMKPYTFLKCEDVFESPITGAPWHDERSQRDTFWTPTLKRLGIRHRRAYVTRHTYATAALMKGVNPAYIAAQLGHRDTKMLFEKYARWINAADKGQERRALEAALGNSSPEYPQETNSADKKLKTIGKAGRRDWTRTNDPHHVKVML